jgi:hypothetical protein
LRLQLLSTVTMGKGAVIALSAEGAVEATAAVDGYHGKRLAVATERSDVTRPVVAGGGATRKERGTDQSPSPSRPSTEAGAARSDTLQRDDNIVKDGGRIWNPIHLYRIGQNRMYRYVPVHTSTYRYIPVQDFLKSTY